MGTKFLENSEENHLMDKLSMGASILGMTVIGAMIGTMVSLQTTLSFTLAGTETTLQSIFDQIFPGILPLGATFLYVQLESSKVIVIFDVDGTINQTEVYAVKAYRKALEEVGKTGFSDKEFIERIGAPFEQDVRYFFGENQSEQVEMFKTLIHKYWIDGMKESAKTFEGIHQMLEELKEKGYKLAICSNASKWELDVILRKLEVNDYFDVIQGVTEKNNKKYSLEELLLREKPELAIMVGDCKYSVETALELSRIIDEIISARGGAD